MRSVSGRDRIKYSLYTFLSRLGAFFAMMILAYIWSEIVKAKMFHLNLSIASIGSYLIIIFSWTVIPMLMMKFFMRKAPSGFYEDGVPDVKTTFGDFLSWSLPGEILWIILRIIPFGFYVNYKFGQLLAYPSFWLFDMLYVGPLGFGDRIFGKLQYTAADFLVYGVLDVIFTAVLLLLYFRAYQKLSMEHKDMLQRREEKYKDSEYF